MTPARPRVIVCGTRFGRVYLEGIAHADSPMELAGIVARGSERSRACAAEYSVPLYTDVGRLPDDVDAACVVVSAAASGGQGTALAKALLARGVHVLQEHPVHHDEMAECVRVAARNRVAYRVNTHYPHVAPVRAFIDAARQLLAASPPVFVDGACSLQTKVSFFDVVGRALGRLHPWSFMPAARALEAGNEPPPFRVLEGRVGGVPVTLRVQNQLHVTDPDNHAHVYHRITLGTDGGSLTLVDTHGPLVWVPRPHIPEDVRDRASPIRSAAPSLDAATWSLASPAPAPTWREAMAELWPAAVRATLRAMLPLGTQTHDVEYELSLARMVASANAAIGVPHLLHGPAPVPLPSVPAATP